MLEEVHAVLANLMLALVTLHVSGDVLARSDTASRATITGNKRTGTGRHRLSATLSPALRPHLWRAASPAGRIFPDGKLKRNPRYRQQAIRWRCESPQHRTNRGDKP